MIVVPCCLTDKLLSKLAEFFEADPSPKRGILKSPFNS